MNNSIATRALLIPEILENIFSYITDYKNLVKLLRVNHIWQLETVRAILKLYRNMFYQYNHSILNTLLIYDLGCLQDNISRDNISLEYNKPVYNKIYHPGPEENIHDINLKKLFEHKLSSVEHAIVGLQVLYYESLPLIITKKIDDLISDYLHLEIEIDEILYKYVYSIDNDEREPEYLRGDVL